MHQVFSSQIRETVSFYAGQSKKLLEGPEPKQNGANPPQETLEELPFVIPSPPTYGDFASLVANRPLADLSTAVRRIRVTNKAALAADGKKKLQVN